MLIPQLLISPSNLHPVQFLYNFFTRTLLLDGLSWQLSTPRLGQPDHMQLMALEQSFGSVETQQSASIIRSSILFDQKRSSKSQSSMPCEETIECRSAG